MNAHNTPLRTIILHGLARKKFGPVFRMAVSSAAEAVRALSQLDGFREFVEKHNFRIVCGPSPRAGFVLDTGLVDFNLPAGDLHFVPILRGSKRGGLGKIIAGVLLLAVAFFVPFSSLATGPIFGTVGWGSATAVGGITFGNVAVMSMGLIATGVAQMMAKQDKVNQAEKSKLESFMLDGAVNVTQQGGPVPLIYGRTMVGSTLISAGLDTVNIGSEGGEGSGGGPTTPTIKHAGGSITFGGQPFLNDRVTVNGVRFTFRNGGLYLEVAIGASREESAANLLAALQGSTDTRVTAMTYDMVGGNIIRLTAVAEGAIGDTYTLDKFADHISVSGATLTGGA